VRGPASQAASHPGTRPLKASAEVAFLHGGSLERSRSNTLAPFCGDISFRLDRAAIRSTQGAQFRPTCVVASAPIVSSRSQPCTKAERQAMPVPARRRKQGAATRSGAASPGSITETRRSLGQVAARPMSSACEMVAAARRISCPHVRAVMENLQGSGRRRLRRRPPSLRAAARRRPCSHPRAGV
jgi:hypothetical protein